MKNSEETKLVSKEELAEEMGLVLPKNITDVVLNSVNSMTGSNQLQLPIDYSAGNALKAAYLILSNQKDKDGNYMLSACDTKSVANSLLKMVILGLNPAKDQCYFVKYGKELTLLPSYFGKQMIVRRIKGVIDIRADVIYKDTEYSLEVDEYGNDSIKITKPCPLESRTSENIVGGWAKIILDPTIWGSKEYSCIMNMVDIKNAWNQGATKGNSPAHKNFTGEMVKKSVINRCIKNYINSRDDQDILVAAFKDTIKDEYRGEPLEKEEQNIDFEVNDDVSEAVINIVDDTKDIEFE